MWGQRMLLMRAAARFLGTLAVTILPPSATDGPRASLRVCCLALV